MRFYGPRHSPIWLPFTILRQRFSEPDQGQNCLPYVTRQPLPGFNKAVKICVKGCQNGTIGAAYLQRICSIAGWTIVATAMLTRGFVEFMGGFKSHLRYSNQNKDLR